MEKNDELSFFQGKSILNYSSRKETDKSDFLSINNRNQDFGYFLKFLIYKL